MRQIYLVLLFVFKMATGVRVNSSCECGIPNEDTNRRIVGGTLVAPHRYPWLVSLMLGTQLHCGGAIITDTHVISAGHCITFGIHFTQLTVDIGMYDRLTIDFQQLRIANGIKHPQFTSNDVRDINDIAMLTLAGKINFNQFVKPICLPTPGMEFSGIPLTVAGWGRTDPHATTSSRYLRETKVSLVSTSECVQTKVYRDNLDAATMICAYSMGKDACQGDSGGPLFGPLPKAQSGQTKLYLVGIVSWGIECAMPNYPGVYAKVTRYIDWIHQLTGSAMYCK